MILSKSKGQRLLVISDRPLSDDFSFRSTYSYSNLIRTENFVEDVDDFVSSFEKYFGDIAGNIQERINNEARRLLEKHEYAAAVIASVTLFEDVLRGKLDKDLEKSNNLFSLNKLLDLPFKRELINHNQISELKNWLVIRNKLVHTSERNITKHLATKIINSIEEVIIKIRID